MKKISALLVAIIAAGCAVSPSGPAPLSEQELSIIMDSDSLMKVYRMDVPEDSIILRNVSVDFTDADLQSEAFATLAAKMVYTVTDPSQDGVGIAGPQVGLNRRVVAVQRFDKPGNPFEVYPNARLDSLWGEMTHRSEGCLSVPGKGGVVPRYSKVLVSWKDVETLETVRDTVKGFTAIIFQHEIDHLEGTIYTDKADSVYTRIR